jgi:hypothetical protein
MLYLLVDDDAGYHTLHQADPGGLAGAFLREAARMSAYQERRGRREASIMFRASSGFRRFFRFRVA